MTDARCPSCSLTKDYRYCVNQFHREYEHPVVTKLKALWDTLNRYPFN